MVILSTTTLTRKGQVTIPKEIRDQLGLKPFDRVEFSLEDGTARLRKAREMTLEEIAGSVPGLAIPIDDQIRMAKEERAERWRAAEGG